MKDDPLKIEIIDEKLVIPEDEIWFGHLAKLQIKKKEWRNVNYGKMEKSVKCCDQGKP